MIITPQLDAVPLKEFYGIIITLPIYLHQSYPKPTAGDNDITDPTMLLTLQLHQIGREPA
jgi:hypothetical protein